MCSLVVSNLRSENKDFRYLCAGVSFLQQFSCKCVAEAGGCGRREFILVYPFSCCPVICNCQIKENRGNPVRYLQDVQNQTCLKLQIWQNQKTKPDAVFCHQYQLLNFPDVIFFLRSAYNPNCRCIIL